MGLREEQEIPYSEAVAHWYDEVYIPVVEAIGEEGILKDFPGRTEADLYLWIIKQRHYLSERYGQDVPLERAVAEFSKEFSQGTGRKQLDAEFRKATGKRRKARKKPKVVAVFGSGSVPPDHPIYVEAKRLGGLLAEAGFTLICGGYGGTMEAASRGANQAGGRVIGVTLDLFTPRLQPNPWLTKERRVSDFFPRLKRLTGADAFVVLQGGIGTLTEATLAWTLLQTGQVPPRPFIFVGDSWNRLFDAFRAETFMTERDWALAVVVDSADDAVNLLKDALSPSP
jgi:uncharacterized protein (TIGR00730 family)